MDFEYRWVDSDNIDFIAFSKCMEEYYNTLVGGSRNRKSFIQYNELSQIHNVIVVYDENTPVACASFKRYDSDSAEIKRVWVEKSYRGNHIATTLITMLEDMAKQSGFKKLILQTRLICKDAVSLYNSLGYKRTANYPPYDKMELAICMSKQI